MCNLLYNLKNVNQHFTEMLIFIRLTKIKSLEGKEKCEARAAVLSHLPPPTAPPPDRRGKRGLAGFCRLIPSFSICFQQRVWVFPLQLTAGVLLVSQPVKGLNFSPFPVDCKEGKEVYCPNNTCLEIKEFTVKFLHFLKFPLLALEITDKNRVSVHHQEV